jgi:hypothetical protein
MRNKKWRWLLELIGVSYINDDTENKTESDVVMRCCYVVDYPFGEPPALLCDLPEGHTGPHSALGWVVESV